MNCFKLLLLIFYLYTEASIARKYNETIVLTNLKINKWQIILIKVFLKIRYFKSFITIELVWEKELILLKVSTAKNVWFATIGFSITDSNLKILYTMVAITWQCQVLMQVILHIAIITAKNVDYCCIIHNISKSEGIN